MIELFESASQLIWDINSTIIGAIVFGLLIKFALGGMKMSREIKFRAFDTKFNEWYGASDGFFIFGECPASSKLPELIISQYTGLKDKNGVDIYEGDLIEYSWEGEISIFEIVFKNCSFEAHGGNGYKIGIRATGGLDKNLSFRVVGNIYENKGI